ncbi:MAG: DsrE family protein [Bacteroidia bacterium]|nr:DsrE family protein [Bacteroidia bacterium]
MKKLFLAVILFAITVSVVAKKTKQTLLNNVSVSKVTNQHKVVFQVTSEDTLVHKSLIKQLNNMLTAAPGTKIEVVCHGSGINILVMDKTIVHDKIQQMKNRGVLFMACENTLKERNIGKGKIISEARFVPSALIEIITKQEAGWSYIKDGF